MGLYHKYVFETDGRMIEVPADAFALLWAWMITGQLDVPAHLRAHPAWPGHNDGRRAHLTSALKPYAERAFAMTDPAASDPSAAGGA